jgi:hypothetical protein
MHFEESFQRIMFILASVDKWTIFLIIAIFVAFLLWMTSEAPTRSIGGLGRFDFDREKVRERQAKLAS